MNRLAFGAILLATVAAGVWAATRPLDGEASIARSEAISAWMGSMPRQSDAGTTATSTPSAPCCAAIVGSL